MNSRASILRLLLALVLAAPTASGATTLTFDDREAWAAAVGGSIRTETFDSVPTQRIEGNAGGVLHAPDFDIVIAPNRNHADCCSIANGVFLGELDLLEDAFNELVFHRPVTAFAADVLRVELSFPTGILLTIAGETLRYVPPPSGSPSEGGFFGVVSDTPFTSVLIVAGSTSPRFYTLDNVSFSPVPEPPAASLLVLAAFLALKGKRPASRETRRRARSALQVARLYCRRNCGQFGQPTTVPGPAAPPLFG